MDEREEQALSKGGTVPGESGAGLAGVGPMGGGMAVPPDGALMGGGSIGDTGSMDDAGGPGDTQAKQDGTSLEEDAPAPGQTLTGESNVQPNADGEDDENTESDVPTGGLSSNGTIGGAPTGTTQSGFGDRGL